MSLVVSQPSTIETSTQARTEVNSVEIACFHACLQRFGISCFRRLHGLPPLLLDCFPLVVICSFLATTEPRIATTCGYHLQLRPVCWFLCSFRHLCAGNCSFAPNCAALFRAPCSTVD